MFICIIVADVRSLKSRHGSVHLAWAAQRRGHEVRFVSIDDLSYLDDNSILGITRRARAGDYPRPADFLRALHSEDAVKEEETLSRFDVVFLRYNPLLESVAHAGSPVIDLCWRLRLGGTLVINNPEGVRRAGSGMYLADLPAAVLRALSPSAPSEGEKVFYVRRRQKANVNQMITALTKEGYAVAQEYPPEAEQGEKRVVLLGGEPIRFG